MRFVNTVLALLAITQLVAVSADANCAVCVLLVGLIERIAMDEKITIKQAVDNICANFKDGTLIFICDALLEPILVPAIDGDYQKGLSPDVTCKEGGAAFLGMCKNYPQCTLYAKWPPPPSHVSASQSAKHVVGLMGLMNQVHAPRAQAQQRGDITKHFPVFDLDDDAFSQVESLRGSHWRGKDCNELDPKQYPGRQLDHLGAFGDHNCNGINGTDASGKSYEELFCSGPYAPRGTIILGDSAAAHFRIPESYLDPRGQNSSHTFDDLIPLIEDELDVPQCSWATGYYAAKDCPPSALPVSSFYQQMRRHNRCNHRDYQNIGVNGARTGSMAPEGIVNALARTKADAPAIVFHALIGNDVCSGHAGFDHMTTPEEFERNVLNTLAFLETRLAAGSSVIFFPLVDGRVLFDTMHALQHPVGATYANVYDYLNCLETSPCWGWMNSNSTVRDLTTKRAMELNKVYEKIIQERQGSFPSFRMLYHTFDWQAQFAEWTGQGRNASDLIEPTDGFHPSTTANQVIAEKVWNFTITETPEVIGPINPFNAEIDRIFGSQGGH
jgi:acyloxyacyl hydrolase